MVKKGKIMKHLCIYCREVITPDVKILDVAQFMKVLVKRFLTSGFLRGQ